MAGLGDGTRHARAFLAKQQDIAGLKAEIIGRVTALGGEQHQPSRTDGGPERAEIGVAGYGHMIDIVHRSPADPAIIPREPHRLDQVNSRAHTGTKAQDGADVPGNLRFEKGNAHASCLAPASEPCKPAVVVLGYGGAKHGDNALILHSQCPLAPFCLFMDITLALPYIRAQLFLTMAIGGAR